MLAEHAATFPTTCHHTSAQHGSAAHMDSVCKGHPYSSKPWTQLGCKQPDITGIAGDCETLLVWYPVGMATTTVSSDQMTSCLDHCANFSNIP